MENFILLIETMMVWFLEIAKWCLIAACIALVLYFAFAGITIVLKNIYGEKELKRIVKNFLA